jgi:hypothetical protein
MFSALTSIMVAFTVSRIFEFPTAQKLYDAVQRNVIEA